MKDIARISKNAFNAVAIPISDYVNKVKYNRNQLSKSLHGISEAMAKLENNIATSQNKKFIKEWEKDLAKLRKQFEKHPGNPDNYDPEKKRAKKKKAAEDDYALTRWVKGLLKTDSFLSLGKTILTKGMDQQKSVAALTPQLGKEGATAAYATIKKDAAATPFDTESLFAANKALIDAGANSDVARANVLALGEAVAFKGGGNEELTKAAELMARIKDSGSAGKDELKEFGEAGIDIYSALAGYTGKSIEETKNMNVSYQDLSAALQKAGAAGGAFEGAMATQNQTASAGMDNFMESLNGGLAEIGVAFMPLLSKIFGIGMKLIDGLLPIIQGFIQPVVDILGTLPLDAILNDVMTMVGAILTAVTPILDNLKPLFAAIFDVMQPLIDQVSLFITLLVQALAPIIASLIKLLVSILGPVIRFIGVILTVVFAMSNILLKLIQPVWDKISWVINKIGEGITWLMDVLGLNSIGKLDGDPIPDDKNKLSSTPESNSVLPSTTLDGTSLTAAGTAANQSMTGNTSVEKTSDKTASEITSGGPRVININGVKFTEKIELHVTNAKEGLYDLELKLQEMFLRILNSGAVLQ
jgi:hypothetical protein